MNLGHRITPSDLINNIKSCHQIYQITSSNHTINLDHQVTLSNHIIKSYNQLTSLNHTFKFIKSHHQVISTNHTINSHHQIVLSEPCNGLWSILLKHPLKSMKYLSIFSKPSTYAIFSLSQIVDHFINRLFVIQ